MNHFEYFLFCLHVGITIFWAGYFAVHLIAICYAKFKLHRKKFGLASCENGGFVSVSIIKPLVGSDPNLQSNLETFFTLKYHRYELLFCLDDDSDPAYDVLKSLLAKFSNVDARLFVGGEQIGVNPKINNMMPAYRAAKYDLIMVSDAGMRMKEDTLTDMVSAMTFDVGIVTQMPFTCDRPGFAATVEKIYFGTAQARIYLAADLFGFICSTGMSSMFRKKVLDELGGMQAFSTYLAEDYHFASAIVSKGWKCAIASQPGWQNNGAYSLTAFHNRIERWAKLRMFLVPLTVFLEPIQECLLLGFLASYATNALFGWHPIPFLPLHVLTWMLSDYLLLSIIQNDSLPFSKLEFLAGWLYREASALPGFLRALSNPRVQWRSRIYEMSWGSVAKEINVQALTTRLHFGPTFDA